MDSGTCTEIKAEDLSSKPVMAAVMPSDDNSVNWVKDVLGGTGLYVGVTNDDHDYVLIFFFYSLLFTLHF